MATIILVGSTWWTLRAFAPAGYFYTHDSHYHIIRLAHFVQSVQAGQFPVRYSSRLLYNYGYPLFTFTYPWPYLIATPLVLAGVTLTASLKASLILAQLITTLMMFWWLKQRTKLVWAVIATLVFIFTPFRFLTLFVTGQIGVVWSWAWLTTLGLGIELLTQQQNARRGQVVISLAIMGSILSHLPTILVAGPLFLWQFISLVITKRLALKSIIIRFASSFGIGLLLSSWYWLPALVQLPLVKAGHQLIVDPTVHLVSWHQLLYSPWGYGYSDPGFSDLLSFQLGIGQWLAIGLILVMLIISWVVSQKLPLKLSSLWLMNLGYLVLMTPISGQLWRLPLVSTLQHPWRLLSISAILIALLIGEVGQHIHIVSRNKNLVLSWVSLLVAGGVGLISVYGTRNYQQPMESTRYPDAHYLSRSDWYWGSGDVANEFLPIAITNPPNNFAPYWLETLAGEQIIATNLDSDATTTKAEFSLDQDSWLQVSAIAWPNLQARLDDALVQIRSGPTGLVQIPVPAGTHTLQLTPHTSTIEQLSLISTMVGLLAIIYQLRQIFNKKYR